MKRSRKLARREPGTESGSIPSGRGRALDIAGQLDVARCPKCDGPMTPRLNRQGSYFHCFCHVRREQERARQASGIENKVLAGVPSSAGITAPEQLPIPTCNNSLSSVG